MIRRVVVASALVATAVLVATASPTAALSCAASPPDAPQIAAVNGEVYGGPFFDEYDFAVVATVTGIETDETPGSTTYGATTIDADVALVLGEAEASETIQLSAADPGWMAGYSFRVGRAYFVPVDAVGPQGEVNHTFLCTPITEVDDADATADRLAALAADADVPHAQPGDEAEEAVRVAPSPTPTEADEASDSSTRPLLIVGAVVLVLAGALVVIRRWAASSRGVG